MAACGAAFAAGAVATYRRSAVYSQPVELWADAAAKSPDRARPWLNLGVELMLADRLEEAERALVEAARFEPDEGRAHCALEAVRIRRSALALGARLERRTES
jgi:Flp pilus assembly protein TadD